MTINKKNKVKSQFLIIKKTFQFRTKISLNSQSKQMPIFRIKSKNKVKITNSMQKYHFLKISKIWKRIKNNIFKQILNFFNQTLIKKIDMLAPPDIEPAMA